MKKVSGICKTLLGVGTLIMLFSAQHAFAWNAWFTNGSSWFPIYSINTTSPFSNPKGGSPTIGMNLQGSYPPVYTVLHLKITSCPPGATCSFPSSNAGMTFPAGEYVASVNYQSDQQITSPYVSNATQSGTLSVAAQTCSSWSSNTCWGASSYYTISLPINLPPPNTAPHAPSITGPTTGIINTSSTFTATASDDQNDQIRYGFDWNMDGVADTWVPAGNAYVNSGTSQSASQSWSTTGAHTFQVLAQDAPGLNSPWTQYTITTSNPAAPTATLTGTAWQTWSGNGRDTAWVYSNSNGPLIVYTGATFALNWTSSNATACTIDGKNETPVAGGTDNTYTAGGGGWSHTYTLSCQNSAGTTVTKTVTVSVPPNPTNVTGSCSSNGQTFSLAWTLPPGYTQAYIRVHDETSNTYPIYIDGYTGTSYSGSVTPLDKYSYWIHAYASSSTAWSDGVGSLDGQPTNVTCSIANTAPHGSNGTGTGPTVTGPTTGYTNNTYTFTATASDDQNNQIRYGFDWNMDGTADTWMPAGSAYVNSGTSQSASHSWTSTGGHTFQVLAQDTVGSNSPWTPYTITLSNQVFPPTVSITASPSSMTLPANSTRLTWTTTNNPDTCTGTGGSNWSGSKSPTGGYQDISNLPAGTYDFTISCQNTANTAVSNAHVVVNAALPTYSLNVTNSYGGTVRSADTYVNCGATCSHTYTQGDTVTLTAIPTSSQWTFAGWSGACTGTGTCTVTMNAAKTVTALFTLHPINYNEF